MKTVETVILTVIILLILNFCYNVCERVEGGKEQGCAPVHQKEAETDAVQGMSGEETDARRTVR